MSRITRRACIGLMTLGMSVVALTGVAEAAPFTNGSFELPPPATSNSFARTGTQVTGWTVTANDVDLVATFWTPQDGSRSLDLNGVAPGTICQTFDTTAGTSYTVGYWMSRNAAQGLASASMTTSITGGPSQNVTHKAAWTPANPNWQFRSLAFTAGAGTSSTLCFASNVAGAFGPAIDNVTIAEVLPVPLADPRVLGIAGVIIAAFGASAAYLRRRRSPGSTMA